MEQPDHREDENLAPGDGLRQTYGAWAEDGEALDEFIECCRQQRKIEKLPPGEGLQRAYGTWKGDDEEGLDTYLDWCRQQRKQESHRELDD